MDYFVRYERFSQGVLRGKVGIVVANSNIAEATKQAAEVVKTFAEQYPAVPKIEEKICVETVIYH